MFNGCFTVEDSEYADELFKLDFPNLFLNPEECELIYNYCIKNDMKFLKGSYGTIVNKNFDKYFELVFQELKEEMLREIPRQFRDHVNLLKSKKYKKVYFLTTSPYHNFCAEDAYDLKESILSAYVISPLFLDYYSFSRIRSTVGGHSYPLSDFNYMFTFNPNDVVRINEDIFKDMQFSPFHSIFSKVVD